MGAVPGTSARSGSAEDTSFSGATGAACCPRPAGQPGPPSEQFREKGQKRHCATEARFTRKHGYVWPGGRCTTHGRADSGSTGWYTSACFQFPQASGEKTGGKPFSKATTSHTQLTNLKAFTRSFTHSLTHHLAGGVQGSYTRTVES